MKALQVFFILALCFAAAGCTTPGKSMDEVVYDYNVTTDFTGIKTYDWHPTSGGNKINYLTAARIKSAVDSRLQARGVEKASASPDFLIIIYGGNSNEFSTKWRGWDDELWFAQGRLKLAFFDPESNEVFWWAETRADVFYNMPPDSKNRVVDDAVDRILAKFPPNLAE